MLLHDGRLALIRRERPDGAEHCLPGGLLQSGEDPGTVLHRELLEELGLGEAMLRLLVGGELGAAGRGGCRCRRSPDAGPVRQAPLLACRSVRAIGCVPVKLIAVLTSIC
ncbi:NUDIX domain-containing protein [Kitasatospora sp. NPDC051853]|uniref:NUDIX domain-containing protein n=1 Tax=Kitasatospora sp. NPDC051853 TaxID=3364058 RepID=UPI003797C696